MRSIVSIQVAKLVIQQTGTYNGIHSRPYETHLHAWDLQNVLNRVQDNPNITGAALAGALGGMVEPSATPGQQVAIPNGWQTVRGRFVMEVHVTFNLGTTLVYYFQGYTDHFGVSLQGSLDPNMVFTINSFMTVSRLNQLTPMGAVTQDIVTETGHLLTSQGWTDPYSGKSQYMMRPQDIFSGIESSYRMVDDMYSQSGILDTRHMLKADPARSSRGNNVPTTYVAKVIEGFTRGAALLEYGQGSQDVYNRARQNVYEANAAENPFVRSISDVRSNGITNTFTFTDLELVDRNVRHVTNLLSLSPQQMGTLHQTGATAYWTGTDRETLMATVLSHAVPALMMETMISKVQIFSHNHDITGAMDTKLIAPLGLSNADMTRQFELFKQRFEREVMYNLTFGNQERYTVEIRCDLFGDTWINVGIAGNPSVMFNTPSFADGLFTPVIATDMNQFNNVVHDFETLLNQVTDVSGMRNTVVNSAI